MIQQQLCESDEWYAKRLFCAAPPPSSSKYDVNICHTGIIDNDCVVCCDTHRLAFIYLLLSTVYVHVLYSVKMVYCMSTYV